MTDVTLTQVALFLAAAVVAAPLAKLLRIGNVLGYLLVGVLIGPFGVGFVYSVYEVSSVLHFAEFGVVLLLFLIGLELRPRRLWALRSSIFGLGGAQVALTALVLAGIAIAFGLVWPAALFAGLALSLSSTAFALQLLEEKGELALRHGRLAFAILLFQDLAAIPLIALTPLFAVSARGSAPPMEILAALRAIGVILVVVVVGRFVLDGMIRLIARTRVKEAMTACALLTVVGVTLAMEKAGLSASLGAFIAGVLLAELGLSPRDRGRHRPIRGPAARPLLHRHRHVARPQPDHRAAASGDRHRGGPAGGQERRALCARPPCRPGGRDRRDGWRFPLPRAASSPSFCSAGAWPPASWKARSPMSYRSP